MSKEMNINGPRAMRIILTSSGTFQAQFRRENPFNKAKDNII